MLKVVAKKLDTTRGKVSKEWQKYRKEKQKIKSLKRLAPDQKRMRVASALDETKQNISKDWTQYREIKHGIIHKSPYHDFYFVKKLTGVKKEVEGQKEFFKFHDSYQKIYRAKRGFNPDRLDDVIPDVLGQSNVRGVLVVFQVYSEESGQTMLASNYINRELMDIIQERDETVFEYVSKKLYLGDTKGVDLKFIYMRIIYKK